MFKSTEKINKKAWSNIVKDYDKLVTDILRPTKSQLRIWRNILKKIKTKNPNPKGLILGATPEFRDLFLDLGFSSYAVDFNQKMLDGMTELMKHKNHPQDIIQAGNWLEINFADNYFDVVLGDASLNQLTKLNDLEKLLLKLKKILQPGGALLTREMVMLSLKPTFKTAAIIAKYQKGLIKRGELMVEFRVNSELFPPQSPRVVDTHLIYSKLKQEYQADRLDQDLFNWLKRTYSSGSKLLNIFLKSDLEKMLRKYFVLQPIKQPRDLTDCHYMPLFYGFNNK